MLDILIKKGLIVDGSGSPGRVGDVGVRGDTIVDAGALAGAEARTVIDVSNYVVAPGFVDMHSHSDFTLPINPTADSLVHQGITTAVVGQCGISPVPAKNESIEEVVSPLMGVLETGGLPLPWSEWSTFESYLDHLTGVKTAINAVPLVGQGTIRGLAMGFAAGPSNAYQMSQMQTEVIEALDAGAVSISTGLIYPPGSLAEVEELIEVVRPVGERDGIYFSHIRGEGDTLLDAVAEAIRIGKETGAAVQISHFKVAGRGNWSKASQALALIDKARAEGLDVTADMYPYLASSTILAAMLPEWAHEGGTAAALARLADPDVRAEMATAMKTTGFFRLTEWEKVMISRSPVHQEYEGRYVAELANEAGQMPYEWVFDALRESELGMSMIIFRMSEENRRMALQHPTMMIGTDGFGLATKGPLSGGTPHPRSYGTFPRVLSHYVRDQGVISLEQAIWRMSGLPARKLGWLDRGLVKRGQKADLVVFDPETVADLSTYEAPHQYATGIIHVLVNGEPVIRDGVHTLARPGTVLRRA